MTNYNNGKIYKIMPMVKHDEGEIYIGSTTKQYLSQRMVKHRSYYKEYKNGKGSCVRSHLLFDKYGVDNCCIILIETVNANTKDELLSREKHYIESLKCVNKMIPLRLKEFGSKAAYQKSYNKQYRELNKDELLKKQKEYRINNQDKIIKLRADNKFKSELVRKEHYERDKDKEDCNHLKHCDFCYRSITRRHFARHLRSPRHLNNLNTTQYEYFYKDGTPCTINEYILYN